MLFFLKSRKSGLLLRRPNAKLLATDDESSSDEILLIEGSECLDAGWLGGDSRGSDTRVTGLETDKGIGVGMLATRDLRWAVVEAKRSDLYLSIESGVGVKSSALVPIRRPKSCDGTASAVDGRDDAGDACDPDTDRWMAIVCSDGDPSPDRRRIPDTVGGDSRGAPGLVTKNGGVDGEEEDARSSEANGNDVALVSADENEDTPPPRPGAAPNPKPLSSTCSSLWCCNS